MIVAGSASPLLLSSAGGYNLTKSLRFRSSASAYLNRTPASAGNRQTWTWSAWVKRGVFQYEGMFSCYVGSGTVDTSYMEISFNADKLQVSGYTTVYRQTSQVFRDPSAWYHIVVALDTTQATGSNRVKVYVNGSQVTAFAASNDPTQNANLGINQAALHNLGNNAYFSNYFDGYMTEINFIDGQQLTPTSFGSTNAATGVWQPIKYTGTYGTNGFYLPFTDVATTSGSNAGLGKDFSGNGNYWTTNNISVTSGSTYDSMKDVPTLTDTDTANYAVLNPLYIKSTFTLSNANLSVTNSTESQGKSFSTIGVSSGKWYWESQQTTANAFAWMIGVSQLSNETNYFGQDTISWGWATDNNKYYNNSGTSYGTSSNTTGEIYMVALDCDSGKIWFGMNGTWFSSGNPASGINESFSGLSGTLFAGARPYGGNVGAMNFGQRPFAHTPPTGFKALNTFNLPTPTIGATASTVANKYMDATLYTGNGSTQSITNAGGFQPDLVWYKGRSTAYNHRLFDVIRGVTKDLQSNSTDAEGTISGLTAFNSNGFSLGSEVGGNNNGTTYVAWQWKANGSGSSNTAGSITSTVSANTTAGFSIVTYTGTGANATVGHGLGVAPSMIIVKRRDSGSSGWSVYFTTLPAGYVLSLQSTNGQANSSNRFTTTLPTSTVFSLGTDSDLNASGGTYVAYCFAQIAGYSAFGSYTGNGSSDGPFVFTGFRPRFILFKNASSAGTVWVIFDTARNTYNFADSQLRPNESSAENSAGSSYSFDILSNGFKVRSSDSNFNGNGDTFIYAAFAESPFKYANAR